MHSIPLKEISGDANICPMQPQMMLPPCGNHLWHSLWSLRWFPGFWIFWNLEDKNRSIWEHTPDSGGFPWNLQYGSPLLCLLWQETNAQTTSKDIPVSCNIQANWDCFSFGVLDNVLVDNLECKTTVQQYFSKLQSMTSSMFPDNVPLCPIYCHKLNANLHSKNRYKQLLQANGTISKIGWRADLHFRQIKWLLKMGQWLYSALHALSLASTFQ